jgi:hypothetical protein
MPAPVKVEIPSLANLEASLHYYKTGFKSMDKSTINRKRKHYSDVMFQLELLYQKTRRIHGENRLIARRFGNIAVQFVDYMFNREVLDIKKRMNTIKEIKKVLYTRRLELDKPKQELAHIE